MTSGKSVTFEISAKSPAASGCPGQTSYQWLISANQDINGGTGNTYYLRTGSSYPSVSVSSCVTATNLVLSSLSPNSIITTNTNALVSLTATLTNAATKAPIANETLTFTMGGEPINCNQTPVITNSSGVGTCSYSPQAAPNTPLAAGNYDAFAHFTGDMAPVPPFGSSDSEAQQLSVNASGTGLAVPDVTSVYGGTATLSATLTGGSSSAPLSGKTISFTLNSVSVGSAVTDNTGLATVPNVSIASFNPGTYTGYIGASFAGDGTYAAVSNSAALYVTQLGQTITFNPIADQPYIAGSITVTASASSGLPVSFSTTSTACSVSVTTVSFNTVGSCSVTASQSGNTTYSAAASVTQIFNITSSSATINLSNMMQTYTGGPLQPTVTTVPAGLSYSLSGAPQTNAASYTVTATITAPGYSGSTTGTFVITKATPTVTWSNPANITYGTALSSAQLNAIASVPGTFVYTPGAGTVLSAGSAQTLSVQFTPTDTSNYNTPAAKTVQINVLKATPTVTWSNPADITYGTALSSTQLNATASVAGSFVYTPAAGTILNAGSGQTLSVQFTPSDTADYNTPAAKTVLINVAKALATVNLGNLTQTYTGQSLSPSATTIPAGLGIVWTNAPQTAVGSYTVTATVSDLNYSGSATGTFTITGLTQTITINSFTVAAKATSGGAVTFSTGTPAICTVAATNPATDASGNYTAQVTLVTTNPSATFDQCKVLTNQNGAGTNYQAAPQVTAILGNPSL